MKKMLAFLLTMTMLLGLCACGGKPSIDNSIPVGDDTTTSTTEATSSNGSKSTTTVDETGKVEAEVTVTSSAVNAAAKADEAVALPMPEVPVTSDAENAPTVEIDLPASVDEAKVEIPVETVTAGTVAILVHADGTEEIITGTIPTENGVALPVTGDVTVKIVDNSKDFHDVAEDYALSDSIDFVSARGLFEGNTETTFNPHANTTVAQTRLSWPA